MNKTAMIRARTEPGLKNDVEKILRILGLSFTEAINLFFQQVRLQKGLPFDVKIPNKTTLRTIKNIERGKGIIKSKDAKDMFNKLGV